MEIFRLVAGVFKAEEDSALARQYLECLLKSEHTNLNSIQSLSRKNIDGFSIRNYRSWESMNHRYRYAAEKWYIHLTRVKSPDSQLVTLASEFLHSLQFTYWVEYVHKHMGCMAWFHQAHQALTIWSAKLSAENRALLRLEKYFEGPYEGLVQKLKSHNDEDMSWQALWRLAVFFGERGMFSDMKNTWIRVLDSLGDAHEKHAREILRARINLADAYMLQGDVLEAHRMYVEIAEEEQRFNPRRVPRALLKQGRAELLMNNTEQTLETLSSLWNGNTSIEEESLGMYLAHVLHIHTTQIVDPNSSSQPCIDYYMVVGPRGLGYWTPRARATQMCTVDIYRLRGNKAEAIRRGERFRTLEYPMSCLCTVDWAITLAIVYRDFGMSKEADNLLREIEQFGMLDDKDRHVRLCQVKHLRSLLLCDRGAVNEAISVLQDLLHQVGHDKNNRTLLWVRLDLAQMLRHRRREGDEAEAASLFSGIVQKRADAELSNDIDLLEQAERAIQMVRDGPYDQVGKAEEFLRGQGLCWVRESDLWLHMGLGEFLAADTTRMKPLQSKEFEEFKDGNDCSVVKAVGILMLLRVMFYFL